MVWKQYPILYIDIHSDKKRFWKLWIEKKGDIYLLCREYGIINGKITIPNPIEMSDEKKIITKANMLFRKKKESGFYEMNKMKQIQLDEKQAIEFALKALATRFNEDEMKRITVDAKELLKPVRKEDEGNDLWSIFNVVQEKILDGDFNYVAGNRSRKARRIKNFNQDLKVNKELFAVAAKYIAA